MQRLGLGLILLMSLALNFFRLDREGYANLYYAAGIKSMMMNWHNFFFVSFDPGGFITLDKPPLGFWIQALSAAMMGFHGWALIIPQAVCGTASVYLVYSIVKQYHGKMAGLVSAAALAATPIVVAASRNNTIDVLLMFVLLLAAKLFLQASVEQDTKKLLAAFFLVGIGFNIKSLQAYMILPAFYSTYLFSTPADYKRKLVHLLMGTAILAASSLPWFVLVDMIPPDKRPYVGSSETNSELELATGYNGLGHFLGYGIRIPGRSSGFLPRRSESAAPAAVNPDAGTSSAVSGQQQTATAGRMLGGETGVPSLLRLFNRQMGGQISWLLPIPLLGFGMVAYQLRKSSLVAKSRVNNLFWSSWLIPQLIFFSIAQGTHRYYLVMMAPAIAALAGIHFRTLQLWTAKQGFWKYLLPVTIATTFAAQFMIVSSYDEWREWTLPLLIGCGISSIAAAVYASAKNTVISVRARKTAALFCMAGALVLPFAWSITPALYGSVNSAFPFAGPDLNREKPGRQTGFQLFGGLPGFSAGRLAEYLQANRQGERVLAAVPNARIASSLILRTGEETIAYGGFLGMEKILSVDRLKYLVESRQLRFVMTISNGQQPEIEDWVKKNGRELSVTLWMEPQSEEAAPHVWRQQVLKLYDCRPLPER